MKTTRQKGAKNQRGAVALVTVIIIGAILLVLGVTASHIGQTEIIIAGQMDRSQMARTQALACVEEALYRLKLDDAYAGGTLAVGGGSCSVTVTGTGMNRTVTSAASSGEYTKTVQISASQRLNADFDAHSWNIDAWQEVNP